MEGTERIPADDIPWFFIDEPSLENNKTYRLPEAEARHASQAMRLDSNSTIIVTNGEGDKATCTLLIEKRSVSAKALKVEKARRNSYAPTLICCPLKNSDRMEWLVEKAIEIGVNQILWVKSTRSAKKAVRLERMKRVAISAIKQSRKPYLPDISCIAWQEFTETRPRNGLMLVAHCFDYPHMARKPLIELLKTERPIAMMVGPEGDFTKKEMQDLHDLGFKAVSLGNERLRSETAGIFALSCISTISPE